MSETQETGSGKPSSIVADLSRVREEAPAGSNAQTIIETHKQHRAARRKVESSLQEKHPLPRTFERRRKVIDELRRAPMPKRVSRTERRASRVGTEDLRKEVAERETVENAFYSAFGLLEKDYQNNNLTPEERWAYESIKAAKEKTIDKGKSAFTNEFKNLETGETYTQEEGIPVENLLVFLQKKMDSLPLNSHDRNELYRIGSLIYRNSQSFTSLPRRMEPARLLGRVRQEAYFVSKDVRATGSDFDNWLKGERTLMARLELTLPPPEIPKAKDVVTAPVPKEPATEATTALSTEISPQAVVAPSVEAPAAAPTVTPPTPEAASQTAEPQPETLDEVRREHSIIIGRRDTDVAKRARELADQLLTKELRKGSAFNPLNWGRKIGLRVMEDYWRQRLTAQIAEAMRQNNNSYLNLDLSKSSIVALDLFRSSARNVALETQAEKASGKKAGEEKVEQIQIGEKIEGEEIVEVEGELKKMMIGEILRPIVDGQITTEEQIQQKLREFVRAHENDSQVQAVFGRNKTQYGRLADYFASNLAEVGEAIKKDRANHHFALEQLDEVIKIKLANMRWAAETEATFGATDKAIAWLQRHRATGLIANPAFIGAAVSLGTFALLRAPGGAARVAAPFVAPVVGTLAGAAVAAARRNYDLKVDMAMHRRERTYNLQIPQGAHRREALERFAYNTASVNELINGGGQELLTGTARRSLQELLGQDLSDGQVTNRANVLRRVAEIKTRLDFSSKEKADLITFEAREQVEQGRLALVKEIVAARQTLRTAGMSDAEISQLETNFTGEWSSRFTQNREQQDNTFRSYRLRNAAGAAVFGGAAGALGGFVTQEGLAQIARHLPEAANIPVIGGLFQKGETALEKGIRQGQELLRGGPPAPPTPTAGPLIETTSVLLDPKTGVEANDITGHRTSIPKGTEWVRDPVDSNKWDLRVAGTDKVLLSDAQFDSSGKLAKYDSATSRVDLFDLENKAQPPEALTGQRAIDEWGKLKTDIHHREWYAYDKPGAQGNELRLYTAKDGDAVTLDMSKMEQGFQKGLTPNPIDVQEIIKTQKSGFMFSIPGPEGKLISVWIPDGADGAWDGKLRLDPNDTTHFVEFNGKQMKLGEFSKMVLNQDAVKPLSNGDIATELYNRQNVFKLGVGGKMGFIETGTLVDRPEGKVLQAFATIRGNGEVQVKLPKGFVAEVTLKGPWVEEIKELVPAPEAPLPQPIEGEAPPIIPTPFAPRHPLEPLGKPGETPQAPPPPPSRREPEGEAPLQTEQTIADQTLADQLTAARDELAGLKQGLAAAGIEPNLEQKAKLEQLQAEVKRLQQETAAAPAPAPAPQPPPPPPPAAAGPTAPAPGPIPPAAEGVAPGETLHDETAAAEAPAEPLEATEKKLASTIDQLPPLKEGFVRLVHLTQPNFAKEIVETGLDYSKQGMIDSTARAYGDASQAEYSSQDPRFNYPDVKAVILDVPEDQYRLYRNVSDPNNPGKVPAEYVVGVIDAYKPPPQAPPAPAGPAVQPAGSPPTAEESLAVQVPVAPAPAPVAGPAQAQPPQPQPPKVSLKERLAGIFGRRQTQPPAAKAQAAAEPETSPSPQPPPTPPPTRDEPLSLEDIQRLKMRVEEIQTEKDLTKKLSMVETLSQSLQADSQQSPQPLKVEETKALITEDLLKLGEEDLFNLLQKYSSLKEALVMLRERDIPNIKNTSIILKALRSQANAQEILRLLDQKQPPEFLSTRPQPPAQPPTGPLLTKEELAALERARADIRNMGIPPPPPVAEPLEGTVAAVIAPASAQPPPIEAEVPPQTEQTIADQTLADQLTAARDELTGLQQGLAAARRDGIEPNLEQQAKLKQLQAEVERLQQEAAPLTPAEPRQAETLEGGVTTTTAPLSEQPQPPPTLQQEVATEAPALLFYVVYAGRELGGLTRTEQETLAKTLKERYFEDKEFTEEKTFVTQDQLKEILRDVIDRWHWVRRYLRNAGDKKSFTKEDSNYLKSFQNIAKKIAPKENRSFKERLAWQLFTAMRRKEPGDYSPGEIRAFIRAIQIMERAQSKKDKGNE